MQYTVLKAFGDSFEYAINHRGEEAYKTGDEEFGKLIRRVVQISVDGSGSVVFDDVGKRPEPAANTTVPIDWWSCGAGMQFWYQLRDKLPMMPNPVIECSDPSDSAMYHKRIVISSQEVVLTLMTMVRALTLTLTINTSITLPYVSTLINQLHLDRLEDQENGTAQGRTHKMDSTSPIHRHITRRSRSTSGVDQTVSNPTHTLHPFH